LNITKKDLQKASGPYMQEVDAQHRLNGERRAPAFDTGCG
jgi:hypothetical protein